MSTTDAGSESSTDAGGVPLKLEAVVVPVSDVHRSKAFYQGLGRRLDADFAFDDGFRVPGIQAARDENRPDWYAAYIVAEQAGDDLPL